MVADSVVLSCSPLSRSVSEWYRKLIGDSDRDFLLVGLLHGFKIVSDMSIVPFADSKNYSSALTPQTRPLLNRLFLEEIESGTISRQGFKPLRINSIGAVPKKGSDTPRPITDCSRPAHDSLNSYMFPESSRLPASMMRFRCLVQVVFLVPSISKKLTGRCRFFPNKDNCRVFGGIFTDETNSLWTIVCVWFIVCTCNL